MKVILKNILLMVFVATIIMSAITVSSAEYADTLRVGIYYDTGTVTSLDIGSDVGFNVGIVNGTSFTPVIENTGEVVRSELDRTEGVPSYHVSYSAHSTPQEAAEAIEILKGQGIEAFAGYVNSSYLALGGNFKNNNDATWAAGNLSVKGDAIEVSLKAIRLKDSSGKTIFVVDDSMAGLGVYSKEYQDSDKILTISGSVKGTYRGGFECKSLDGKTMTVVNVVPVESYLYSVVCREMSPSWEVEALKAQAVCARNFALGRINYHKKYGFDVCRTVCCQAYASTADNSESVHEAVDETRGELLFYGDKLVQAVYSSSMGKRTENVENVWGSKFPYLVSVENPYEDTDNIYNGKWTKTLTKERATEIMNNRGYNIGEVTNITVLERTPADSVLKLQVTGTNGSKVFERESCRTIFSEVTYSQRYTVSKGGEITYPLVNIIGGKVAVSVKTDGVFVIGKDGKESKISGSLTAYDGKTTKQYKTTTTGGDPDSYTFSGEGWGHGVGMSQYGAKGMAEKGFSYEEILTHYYTDTHLEKAY